MSLTERLLTGAIVNRQAVQVDAEVARYYPHAPGVAGIVGRVSEVNGDRALVQWGTAGNPPEWESVWELRAPTERDWR